MNRFLKVERQISVWPVKVDHLHSWSWIFRSDQTETDLSNGLQTEISGIFGTMKVLIVSQKTYLYGFHEHSNHGCVRGTQTQKERNSKQSSRVFGCQLTKKKEKIEKLTQSFMHDTLWLSVVSTLPGRAWFRTLRSTNQLVQALYCTLVSHFVFVFLLFITCNCLFVSSFAFCLFFPVNQSGASFCCRAVAEGAWSC